MFNIYAVKKMKNQHLRKPITHGTISGYKHYGCRCTLCKIAVKEAEREWRHKRRTGFVFVGPKPITHGTPAAFNYHGCRCDICVTFIKQYRKESRLKKMARKGIEPREAAAPKARKERAWSLEKHRECGTAEAYSFGCTCQLCITQGFQLFIKEIAA